MIPRLLPLTALAALLGLLPLEALAFELYPISREFAPSGSGATQTYEVVNTGKAPIAINVSVVTRALDSEGTESNQDAEDDFLIYPPQFLVAPGAKQNIRVTWLGNPAPERELAYRLVVEQLPIERFKAKPFSGAPAAGAITVLKRYLGSLYIRPASVRAELEVESTKLERDAAGKPVLAVTVHNSGTGRAVLKDFVLHLPSPGAEPEVSLSPGALALKSTIVLPDGRRRLLFPWPHGFQPVQATVSTALRH